MQFGMVCQLIVMRKPNEVASQKDTVLVEGEDGSSRWQQTSGQYYSCHPLLPLHASVTNVALSVHKLNLNIDEAYVMK